MKKLVLNNALAREAAIRAIADAPDGYVVTIREQKRSEDQSAKFHANCAEVSKSVSYLGQKRTKEQWKVLFISGHSIATGQGAEIVPGLEGEFVNIRESSAEMPKSRMSSLLDYQQAWIANARS